MLSGQNNNKTLLIHWLHLNNEFVNAFCLMLMCGFITSVCLSGCHCARKRATITGTSKRFQLGISMRGGINGWGKRVGKDGESLQNFPRAPPLSPRCSCFSTGGRTTRSVQCWSGGIKGVVTPIVIKDTGQHATPLYPSLPVQTSLRANSLTLQPEQAGVEGWRGGWKILCESWIEGRMDGGMDWGKNREIKH